MPLACSRLIIAVLTLLTPPAAWAATLIHSGNIQGELEPCGCRENPLGGLVRRAEWLERNQSQGPFLQVDAGDLLFASLPIDPDLKPQAEIQAEALLRILKLQGLNAVTPGEKDFALGEATFQKLTKKSGIAFLAANLHVRHKDKLLLPASKIFSLPERGGKTVQTAVIGVVSPQLKWPDSLRVSPALPAIQAEMKRLRKKAGQFLILSHLEPEEASLLAKQLPGVKWIVNAHSTSASEESTAVPSGPDLSGPWILQASYRNRHLGVWADLTGHRNIPLSPDWERPIPDGALTQPTFLAIQSFKNQLALLQTQAPRWTSVKPSPKTHTVQTFVRCFNCHEAQTRFWQNTPHARAYEALHARGQAFNRECLTCHSVGLGVRGAFEKPTEPGRLRPSQGTEPEQDGKWAAEDIRNFFRELTAALPEETPGVRLRRQSPPLPEAQALARVDRLYASVQCENCHGPAGDHPFGAAGALIRPSTSTCLKCHTPEQAPQWYKADGKPDAERLAAQVKAMSCPASSH